MISFYSIFDITLSCEFPLPELPSISGEHASLFVKMGEDSLEQFKTQGFESACKWQNHEGTVVCWVERKDDEYLFVFPRSATFHISTAGVINCYLAEGSSMQLLRHVLLNQIVPRYLATTSHLVLHAGAVKLENGKVVAFLGNSGSGKSTLVSSFLRNGAQLINDDCILLDSGEHGVRVVGGLVGIRLFPDSVKALFKDSEDFVNYTPYADKQQLFLKNLVQNGLNETYFLDALFLLNDPQQDSVDMIMTTPISATEAIMAMIYSAFSLDPTDKMTKRHNFQRVGEAMSKHIGIFSLKYPREHRQLADVRVAVSRCVNSH